MNSGFKTLLYILGVFLVITLILNLAITILPWALLFGGILYIFFKIKGWFIKRKFQKDSSEYYNRETSYSNVKVDTVNTDDVVGDIIDVDYEDVNKK